MKFVLVTFFLFLSVQTFSQRVVSVTPYGTYENDEITKIIPTTDRGCIVIAYNADSDYVMKLDSNYNIKWTKNYFNTDYLLDLVQSDNLEFWGAGSGPNEPWLIRLSSNGDSLWSKRYYQWKPTYFDRIISLSDSSFVLRFYYDVSKKGLIGMNSKGDSLWNVKLTPINLLPIKDSFIAINQTYFKKYTNKGQLALDKTIKVKHGVGSIIALKEGGYLLIGYGVGLSKITNSGDTVWSRYYSESAEVATADVKQTLDSGFLVFGTLYDNFYLLKVDKNGNKQWSHFFSHPFVKEVANYLSLNCDSSVTLIGYSDGGPFGGYDIVLIKVDSMKNVRGQCAITTGLNPEITNSSRINIFPNPVSDGMHLESNLTEIADLRITNMFGETILEHGILNLNEAYIPMGNIPSGMYIIEFHGIRSNKFYRRTFFKL